MTDERAVAASTERRGVTRDGPRTHVGRLLEHVGQRGCGETLEEREAGEGGRVVLDVGIGGIGAPAQRRELRRRQRLRSGGR